MATEDAHYVEILAPDELSLGNMYKLKLDDAPYRDVEYIGPTDMIGHVTFRFKHARFGNYYLVFNETGFELFVGGKHATVYEEPFKPVLKGGKRKRLTKRRRRRRATRRRRA